ERRRESEPAAQREGRVAELVARDGARGVRERERAVEGPRGGGGAHAPRSAGGDLRVGDGAFEDDPLDLVVVRAQALAGDGRRGHVAGRVAQLQVHLRALRVAEAEVAPEEVDRGGAAGAEEGGAG